MRGSVADGRRHGILFVRNFTKLSQSRFYPYLVTVYHGCMRQVLVAIFVVCTSFSSPAPAAEPVQEVPVFPNLAFTSLDGSAQVDLESLRGRPVLMTFWASWCGECRTQLESFEELHQAYGESGLELLSISLDSSLSQAQSTAASLDLSFPVLYDARGEVGELYDVDDLPLVVFVDREGRLREMVEGYSRSEQEVLVDRLRSFLRE